MLKTLVISAMFSTTDIMILPFVHFRKTDFSKVAPWQLQLMSIKFFFHKTCDFGVVVIYCIIYNYVHTYFKSYYIFWQNVASNMNLKIGVNLVLIDRHCPLTVPEFIYLCFFAFFFGLINWKKHHSTAILINNSTQHHNACYAILPKC